MQIIDILYEGCVFLIPYDWLEGLANDYPQVIPSLVAFLSAVHLDLNGYIDDLEPSSGSIVVVP